MSRDERLAQLEDERRACLERLAARTVSHAGRWGALRAEVERAERLLAAMAGGQA